MTSYFSLGLYISNLCLLIAIFFLNNLSIPILEAVDIVPFRFQTSTTAETTKNGVHVLSTNDFHLSLQNVCMTNNVDPYFTLDKATEKASHITVL